MITNDYLFVNIAIKNKNNKEYVEKMAEKIESGWK
jgi:hypothetical protein